MKFCYRGIPYENDCPSVEMTESEISGQYRGHALTYTYPRHIPVPQQTSRLQYRGVAYCSNPRATAEACYAAPSVEPTCRALPSSRKRTEVVDELVEIHQRNILRRLKHRIQVAKNQGDYELVRMLEAESKQLVGR